MSDQETKCGRYLGDDLVCSYWGCEGHPHGDGWRFDEWRGVTGQWLLFSGEALEDYDRMNKKRKGLNLQPRFSHWMREPAKHE